MIEKLNIKNKFIRTRTMSIKVRSNKSQCPFVDSLKQT